MPQGFSEHFTAVKVAQTTAPTVRIAHLGWEIVILRLAARRCGALGGVESVPLWLRINLPCRVKVQNLRKFVASWFSKFVPRKYLEPPICTG